MITRVVFDEDPAVCAAFTSRDPGNLSFVVGDGDVERSRAEALDTVGAQLDDAVFMEQVHSGAVARVGKTDRGRGARGHGDGIRGVDALVTSAAGVALVVLVADCVPVLLVDPDKAIAAVHAGRRGVTEGVIARAVTALAEDPSRVSAVIGPAIEACCYEVPAELADEVAALVPAAKSRTTWGTPSLDLVAAVESQLADAGVRTVRREGGCTQCFTDQWFSHRAAAQGASAGRQAGVIIRSAVPTETLPHQPSTTEASL